MYFFFIFLLFIVSISSTLILYLAQCNHTFASVTPMKLLSSRSSATSVRVNPLVSLKTVLLISPSAISAVFCRELRFPGVEPQENILKSLHYVMLSKPRNLQAKCILGPQIMVKNYYGLASFSHFIHFFPYCSSK